MEEEVVNQLYNLSKLDVYQTLHSLTEIVVTQLTSGFQYDNIPAYCRNIKLMKHLLICIKKNNVTSQSNSLISTCQEIISKVCYPVLGWISPTRDSRKDVLVLLASISRLVATCAVCDGEVLVQVLNYIRDHLEAFLLVKPLSSDLDQSECGVDVYSLCELLRHVLQGMIDERGIQNNSSVLLVLREIFGKLIQSFDLVVFDTVGSLLIPTLTKLLDIDTEHQDAYICTLWKNIQTFSVIAGENKHYLLLCGFANYFFPVTGKPVGADIRREDKLWEILQTGLLSKHSLNRKRCLYLVKRIVDICENGDDNVCTEGKYPVFWWRVDKKKELEKVWEDFMLLAEVFEEKQVHVIKPLLSRMKSLIEAAAIKNKEDRPYLHTSWLTTLLTRCSHHESLQIIRWSTETVLMLDFSACPYFEQGQDKYLSGAVLDTLQEPKLFTREQGSPMGSLPIIAVRLEQFFTNCWRCLTKDRRGPFFCRLLQNICNRDWGPYSLLFICRGLSLVPRSSCLDRDTIVSIRKLLTGHLTSLEVYLRGITLSYIVEAVLHLTDKSQVPVDDFMQMLAVVDRDVCLQRGTTLWSSCADWLKEDVEENSDWSSVSFKKNIEVSLTKYLETSLDSCYGIVDQATGLVLARQLLLACDASIATEVDENQSCCLIRVLEMLASIINAVNTHAYMSQHKADKAIQLLVLIVQELEPAKCAPDDLIYKLVQTSVVQCQDELSAFISRQIKENDLPDCDMGLLEMYVSAVKMMTVTMDTTSCGHLRGLVKTCMTVLESFDQADINPELKMKELLAMCILGLLADFLSHDKFLKSQELRSDVKDLQDSIVSFSSRLHLSPRNPGRVSSVYPENQWRIVRLALLTDKTLWCDSQDLLNQSTDALSVGLNEASIPIMQSMKMVLSTVLSQKDFNTDSILSAIDACFSSLIEVGRSFLFGQILEAFAEVIFQPCLLIQDEDSPITQKLQQFCERLMEMGERQGVVHALAAHFFKAFSQPGMCGHAIKYTQLIKDLCIYGAVQTRTHRQTFDICAAFEGMGDKLSVNGIIPGVPNLDTLARAVTVNFLSKLDPADDTHCRLATGIIQLSVEHYKIMPLNAFANSLVHLQRNRLVQTVLLLQPCVTNEYVTELWNFVWAALQQELQPSVRHMLEWIAMWQMYRHDHLAKQLWVLFDQYQETKNIIVCSLLCIVTHMGPHLPAERQEDYYEHALSRILPWCLAHHFNTRIFAQATIVKLWKQCKTLNLPNILKAHSILGCLVDFNQQNKNSTKNVKKLLDSFFFKFLDFRRDFSLETMFYLLPMMTSITEEDWLRPDLFIQTDRAWETKDVSKFIKLRNSVNHLDNFDPDQILWKYRTLKIEDETEGLLGDHGDGDVQKKIMPWKQMVPDEETSQEIEHGIKPKRDEGLVVVTSLINKVPNLGGLCRTSEIFGVSEYVMGSMKFLEDKLFQSLSVTAHKWLPITEVHETKLADYLQQKRQEGYCLVGVEQTANSVCLTEYKFPQKTLLLLGNEKEGIPVELISLLDVCVEIPQQGVVRSLNVHVSGALLIWEYWRQQLTDGCPTTVKS